MAGLLDYIMPMGGLLGPASNFGLLPSEPQPIAPWITQRPFAGAPEKSSPYGARMDPFGAGLALHTGDDYVLPLGSAVNAAGPGTVTKAETDKDYGNFVDVDHGGGFVTRYGHLSKSNVARGQSINAGHQIGESGSTGRSTGPHLHFEVLDSGSWSDPSRYLDKIIDPAQIDLINRLQRGLGRLYGGGS